MYRFPRNILGYTGEDYRNGKTSRDYLKYSNEECQKYIRELRDFQQQGFANMTAIEICQAVRVRHFIWLDNILSNEFNNQQLPCALEYIKQWYHFFKWYIDNFPLYYADVSLLAKLVCSRPAKQRTLSYRRARVDRALLLRGPRMLQHPLWQHLESAKA